MRRQHRGVALVTVLLIVALLTALAVQLISSQSLVLAQARHTFGNDQSLNYALGGEAYARQILHADAEETQFDSLEEAWANPLPPLELDNGFMEIQIRDLDRCFNLNSVSPSTTTAPTAGGDDDPDSPDEEALAAEREGRQRDRGSGAAVLRAGKERFVNLLRALGLPDAIADVWIDWVDPDDTITGFGAEDSEYLLVEPSYRTPNQPAAHISEVRLLANVEPEQVDLLLQNVCLHPGTDFKLNVNTADAIALQALVPNLAPAKAESFVAGRTPIEDVNLVTAELIELQPVVDALSVRSEYFEIAVRADVNGMITELTSIVHRDPEDGSIELRSRDFGKRFRTLVVPEEE